MRISADDLLGVGQLYTVQQLNRPLAPLLGRHVRMKAKDLVNLAADCHNRIKRGHGLLKNHRYLATANFTQPSFAYLGQVFATKINGPPRHFDMGRRQQTHQRPCGQ